MTPGQIEENIVRTGDPAKVEEMIELIKEARAEGNSTRPSSVRQCW